MSEMLLVIIDGKRVYDNLEFEDDQVFTVIYTALLIMVLIIAIIWSLKMIRYIPWFISIAWSGIYRDLYSIINHGANRSHNLEFEDD